jgi:hypothetical protein
MHQIVSQIKNDTLLMAGITAIFSETPGIKVEN